MKTLFVIYLLFTTGFISLILYEDYKDHHYNGSCNNICAISNGHVVYSDVFNSKALPNTVTSIGGNAFTDCYSVQSIKRKPIRATTTIPKNIKEIKINWDTVVSYCKLRDELFKK
jgi:uncharacterized membrane protein